MSIIGYIRVSCTKQTCEHQQFEIAKFARQNKCKITKYVQETISSRQPLTKRKLGEVLDKLKDGDILIACEMSRLGRSMLEVMRILEMCLNKNCQVWTIKENYRLGNDIQSKVMAFAFGLSAEIERNLISQRTKASLDNLRANGKKLGRPYSDGTKRLYKTKNSVRVRQMLDMGIKKAKIAHVMHVSPVTISRFIHRMQW